MSRIFMGVALAMFLAIPWVGCGGGGGGNGSDEVSAKSESHRPQPQGESRSAIPEKVEPLDAIEGIEIMPYFDEQGTVSEQAISPGDEFTFYVFIAYPEPYYASAVEYRVEMPEGTSILGESKFNDRALTVGSMMDDFSMAFGCIAPAKFYVMKYTCKADESFKGGEIMVTPGVKKNGQTFLGIATCRPDVKKLPGEGGSAVLTLK
jgi:hypothetical protein